MWETTEERVRENSPAFVLYDKLESSLYTEKTIDRGISEKVEPLAGSMAAPIKIT